MRINRLDLLAFGPFTDRILEFNSDVPGLHVIFGPNEAGKSSSLRALKALLYGFSERTSDNFRHANNQLLVGGCIQGKDGRELTFQRRKKRKADLLNPDGSPMDDGILAAFLQPRPVPGYDTPRNARRAYHNPMVRQEIRLQLPCPGKPRGKVTIHP